MIFSRFKRYLFQVRAFQRMNLSLSRAAASLALRQVNLEQPATWEFSGFSQNGEDGIIDVLLQQLTSKTRYFVEIGAGDGLENNTSWLSLTRRFSGLWVEGDPALAEWAKHMFNSLNYGVDIISVFTSRNTVHEIIERSLYADPDLLSVDIDGMDYHV